MFTQRKCSFRKSFFGYCLNLGFPKDCGSGIDQVETGAWNDVVDFKKQHGETKQNFTKRTQLAAPCRRRHQREGMSKQDWQGKLKAGQGLSKQLKVDRLARLQKITRHILHQKAASAGQASLVIQTLEPIVSQSVKPTIR